MSAGDIVLEKDSLGAFHVANISSDSITQASKLLQTNHEQFHVIWETKGGQHNHLVHYLLTILALGATPAQIKSAYEDNCSYTRPINADAEDATLTINDDNFEKSLGRIAKYSAWLDFFRKRIELQGWHEVMNKHLFAETPRAMDLFGRLFEGALHPFIHLGFATEFEQPAIVAEALAQTAIHPLGASGYLHRSEQKAKTLPYLLTKDNLADIFIRSKNDPTISRAECWHAGSYDLNPDFWADLPEGLIQAAASYNLDPGMPADELSMRIAEFFSVTTWFTCAAQRSGKEAKFDFFLMHCINSSLFHSAFEKQTWMSVAQKIRLLEFSMRMGLVFYICQGAPELFVDEIINYQTSGPELTTWTEVHQAAIQRQDDGHIVKFIRALHKAEVVCSPLETRSDLSAKFPIRKPCYLKIANMVLDSTRNSSTTLTKWLRGCALADSWSKVPNKMHNV